MRAYPHDQSKVLFVGIDVSQKTLAVAIDGQAVREFSNDQKGWNKLTSAVTKAKRDVRVVLEATGSYHFDAACHLANSPRVQVMIVNPRMAKAFHLAQGRRAKTDAVDATSLLEMARRMEFTPWKAPGEATFEIRQLSRYVDSLIQEATRLKNQLHAATITSRANEFVVADLRARLADVEGRTTRAENQLLAAVKADAEHQRRVAAMKSVPGVGTATAVRLLSEFLILDPEMTSKQITAYAGLDPRPRESGTSVRGARGISRLGNGRLRRLLYMPAVAVGRIKGPFKSLADRVAERSGKKMVGLVAVMRKLLVTAWAIFKSGQAWDVARAVRGEPMAA